SSRIPPPDTPPWSALPGMSDASRGRMASGIIAGQEPDSEKLFVVLPVQAGSRRLGHLRISLLFGPFRRRFSRVPVAVPLCLAITLLACTGISLLLARGLTEPIARMSAFAEEVGAGRFRSRLSAHSTDEVGRLAMALNRMCERLERQEEERQAFLAAASHELR